MARVETKRHRRGEIAYTTSLNIKRVIYRYAAPGGEGANPTRLFYYRKTLEVGAVGTDDQNYRDIYVFASLLL